MKNKWIVILLSLLVLIGLTACSSKNESSEAVNPTTEVTEQELAEKTGISLPAPAGATDVKYYTIKLSEDETIAEMDFTLDGKTAYLRALQTDQNTIETFISNLTSGNKKPEDVSSETFNISGLSYDWETFAVQEVQERTAITIRKGGIGFIAWVDTVPGIFYNLCMKSGADDQILTDLANQVFVPAQRAVN